MYPFRFATPTAVAVIALAVTAAPAHAQFSFTWDNGGIFSFPASTIQPPDPPTGRDEDAQPYFLTGTVTNTSGQTLFGSDLSSRFAYTAGNSPLLFQNGAFFAGPYTTREFQDFAFLDPAGIAPGASFTGNILRVVVDASTVNGIYDQDSTQTPGVGPRVTLDYRNAAGTLTGNFSSPNVTIIIGGNVTPGPGTAAPEPGTLALALLGIAGGVARRRRR
ncbi:MAG: PEP-CTERM sorting domain-containing protein [Cytophagales bacterium]|nr:PEP-CTERM sorting domain-containing protein [Armatimonadota bacterium]